MNREAKLIYVFYVALFLMAASALCAVLLQSNYIFFLCPLVVFFLPWAFIVLWLWRRMRGIIYTGKLRRHMRIFRLVSMVAWCVSLLPGLFWGVILFHIYEPWPFSRQQGPDTAYAQQGFHKVLGLQTGPAINQIYYKGYDIRDEDGFLRFRSCAQVVEERVLANLQRQPGGQRPPTFHVPSRLAWWFTAAEASEYEHWAGDYKAVWIHRPVCTFYVRKWTT